MAEQRLESERTALEFHLLTPYCRNSLHNKWQNWLNKKTLLIEWFFFRIYNMKRKVMTKRPPSYFGKNSFRKDESTLFSKYSISSSYFFGFSKFKSFLIFRQ